MKCNLLGEVKFNLKNRKPIFIGKRVYNCGPGSGFWPYRMLRSWLQITSRLKTCQVLKTWQVCHPYQKDNIGQILMAR
jgi:hypothetical protein